ncbi:MAG: hypothetical protein LUQ56_02365 [Methylococcaceae bacterium]|nr:hypothetical protein [Methylococcaceae bacterium]MDD1644428.1 hypothetical protein [Methylococcaceae bacterium]
MNLAIDLSGGPLILLYPLGFLGLQKHEQPVMDFTPEAIGADCHPS